MSFFGRKPKRPMYTETSERISQESQAVGQPPPQESQAHGQPHRQYSESSATSKAASTEANVRLPREHEANWPSAGSRNSQVVQQDMHGAARRVDQHAAAQGTTTALPVGGRAPVQQTSPENGIGSGSRRSRFPTGYTAEPASNDRKKTGDNTPVYATYGTPSPPDDNSDGGYQPVGAHAPQRRLQRELDMAQWRRQQRRPTRDQRQQMLEQILLNEQRLYQQQQQQKQKQQQQQQQKQQKQQKQQQQQHQRQMNLDDDVDINEDDSSTTSVDSLEEKLMEFRKSEAMTLIAQKQWDPARQAVEVVLKSLMETPGGTSAAERDSWRERLAELHLEQGKYDEALSAINTIWNHPNDPSYAICKPSGKALRIRGEAFYHTGRLDVAERDIKAAISACRKKKDPTSVEETQHAMYLMSQILGDSGNQVDAKFYRSQVTPEFIRSQERSRSSSRERRRYSSDSLDQVYSRSRS